MVGASYKSGGVQPGSVGDVGFCSADVFLCKGILLVVVGVKWEVVLQDWAAIHEPYAYVCPLVGIIGGVVE